jgi:hypothetical protein
MVGHLTWETLQLPLYTIWSSASPGEIAFAIMHCTAGDMLIAMATLMASLVVMGHPDWPLIGRRSVAALTVMGGLAYTIFSEWLNTGVREAWAYSDLMPTLPLIGTGLSPLMQWVVVPTAALALAGRLATDNAARDGSAGA